MSEPPPDGVAIRVMTYNVRSLRDDPAAVSECIRAARPDVVCVQEAPRFLRWRSKLARLARESGLLVVTGGRTGGSNALLGGLRARVIRTSDVLLPKRGGLHQRGIALAVLEIGGARFAVGSTHLSLDQGERPVQAHQVLALLHGLGEDAAVLGGDVNAEPDGQAWVALAGALRDAHVLRARGGGPTFPASAPARRIDGIFVSPGVRVLGCGVPPDLARGGARPAAASDHLPVVADLLLPRAPREAG